MTAVGGSIIEVGLDGRPFAVAADADATSKRGGRENEIAPNGNGTVRILAARVGWSVSGLTLSIDDQRDDVEFLQDLADSGRAFPIYVKYASNATYGATGTITGELGWGSANSSCEVGLGGGGKLELQ